MTQRFKNKVALVTGGSRGIGAAIAQRLADEGASVTITYVGSEATAQAVVDAISEKGGRARALRVDASESGASAQAVDDIVTHDGGLDILISNAGINISKPLPALSPADYEKTFGVNVRGTFEVVQAASNVMVAGGRIVVVTATIANSFFAPGLGLYGASKAAANAFVQGWCRDLGPRGITINAVVPGPIDTAMNPGDSQLADHLRGLVPLGRYGTSEEVASLTAFLASAEAGFINGARIIIDGGLTA